MRQAAAAAPHADVSPDAAATPAVAELPDGLVLHAAAGRRDTRRAASVRRRFAVRRRLARVFSICVSQRAVDGLLLGLEDLRFEVRFQCGRSLSAILEKNPRVRIDRERVFDVVRKEVAVGRPVWQSHRLLDNIDPEQRSFVDEFLKDRAGQSLAHVFTLLSLVLPTAPLQIAYRGLHTDDPKLRGTALEYLEGVLPQDLSQRLWPFLGREQQAPRDVRARDEILADLLRSNESIMLNLEELRKRVDKGA